MVQIATNHTILAAITPAIKPESEEAVIRPILNLDFTDSRETKSSKISFIFFNYIIVRPYGYLTKKLDIAILFQA